MHTHVVKIAVWFSATLCHILCVGCDMYMCMLLKYIYTYVCIHMHTHVVYITVCFLASLYHSCDTGWQRLIGSPKLQIIFHKRAIKYRSLLRKMTYKDKGSYESSPPCMYMYVCVCICICICMYMYVHVYVYVYICICMYITLCRRE